MTKQKKPQKTRVKGIDCNYKHKNWLNDSLSADAPNLDYITFANECKSSQKLTNIQYQALLGMLMKNQSNKVTKIATAANTTFKKRNDLDSEFGQKYAEYWDHRDDEGLANAMRQQNEQTILHLNGLTNQSIRAQAEGAHASTPHPTSPVLEEAANLPSDVVGDLDIIDLSLPAVKDLLGEDGDNIEQATALPEYVLSEPAQSLYDALVSSRLSVPSFRTAIRTHGNIINFDLIEHSDLGFIEVTTRYFIDLMASPSSPLNKRTMERTAATFLIVYLVNQLFLSNNDILESRPQINNPCSFGILGGIQDNTSSSKRHNDTKKLFKNMITVLDNSPATEVFCMRSYDTHISFERLLYHDNTLYRKVDCLLDAPSTPRKLQAFIKEVPTMFAWKEAVVNSVTASQN